MNGVTIPIEFDTGSAVTVLSKGAWREIGCPTVQRETKVYRSFTGGSLELLGKVVATVQYRKVSKTLEVLVVQKGCSILGRDLIEELNLFDLTLRDLQQGSVN